MRARRHDRSRASRAVVRGRWARGLSRIANAAKIGLSHIDDRRHSVYEPARSVQWGYMGTNLQPKWARADLCRKQYFFIPNKRSFARVLTMPPMRRGGSARSRRRRTYKLGAQSPASTARGALRTSVWMGNLRNNRLAFSEQVARESNSAL